MITTVAFMDIFSLHRQGFNMRAIAKLLGIHRNIGKRHIEGNAFPQYHKTKRQGSILDPYRQTIDDYLATDDYQSTWIHDRLKNMGYSGSYETVKTYVRSVKERPLDYIRQRFWRGYSYTTMERLNCDVKIWLNESANTRRHGTHQQPIIDRWQQEIQFLVPSPRTDYDTSIKVFRKVYKDCQISYDGNRYLVPYQMVGKKVLPKIKHHRISIYDDNVLLISYQEGLGKHRLIGNRLFYEQLKRDQQQVTRKYGKSKGKATRGLTTGSLFPQVEQRDLAEFQGIKNVN